MKIIVIIISVLSLASTISVNRKLLTNHVYHWTRMTMSVNLCNSTQAPPFKARGEISSIFGNCSCPSWSTNCPTPTHQSLASNHFNGRLVNVHDAIRKLASRHVDSHRRRDVDMMASDWTPITNDACLTQVDFGYRKLLNGHKIDYTFDDAYDFGATIDKTASDKDQKNFEVALPNIVTLFLRSYDKKARVFVESVIISVSYYRQNFDQDETPIEWRPASVREYQYPDMKGNPVLETGHRLVLERTDANNTSTSDVSNYDTDGIDKDDALPRTFKIDTPIRQPRNRNVTQ